MKPRICFYSVATHLGGGERSMLDLILGLAQAGEFEPLVLLPQPEGPLVDILRGKGIASECVPMPTASLKISRERKASSFVYAFLSLPFLAVYLLRLGAALRRARPAVLHTNGIKCHLLGALAGTALGLPVVWHIRDILQPGLTLRLLRAFSFLCAPWMICNSAASAAPFGSGPRLRVIYNGFAWPAPSPAPDLRRELRAGENTAILGIVGVLARWKGQDLFLELGHRLRKAGLDIRLVIVGGKIYDTIGDADFEQELQQKAEQLGLKDCTLFTGFVDNPLDYVRQFRALVHCSIRPEPFGRVIVEAMACGVPALAARAGGVLEIIEHGKDGLLYEPGKIEDLCAKALELLRSPSLAGELAGAAKAKAESRFSLSAHVAAVSSLYRQIS